MYSIIITILLCTLCILTRVRRFSLTMHDVGYINNIIIKLRIKYNMTMGLYAENVAEKVIANVTTAKNYMNIN